MTVRPADVLQRARGICVLSGVRCDRTADFPALPAIVSWWWLLLLVLGPLGIIAAAAMYGIAGAAQRQWITLPVSADAFAAHNRRVRRARRSGSAAAVSAVAFLVVAGTATSSMAVMVVLCALIAVFVASLGMVTWVRSTQLRIRVAANFLVIRNCSNAFAEAVTST